MSIYIQGDDLFTETADAQLGERVFTVSHSSGQATIMVVIGIVGALAATALFLFGPSETVQMYGSIPAMIALFALPIGILQLVRSRVQTHIHEGGIAQTRSADAISIAYDRVSRLHLTFAQINRSMQMKFVFFSGPVSIRFSDNCMPGVVRTKDRMQRLVEYVTHRIPPEVEIEGVHQVHRASEQVDA